LLSFARLFAASGFFGASKLNLKFMAIPVRYVDRTYRTTQISRFTHGILLLRMVLYAFRKLKAI
jgi:hypothetical protein